MKKIFLLAAVLLSAVSCFFPNDLDYPLIKGEFLSLEVEGARSVRIDPAARKVVIDLEERADISHLKLVSYELTKGASCELGPWLDLREPLSVVIKTYQEYPWTLEATQEVQRYVVCQGQVKEANFNLEHHQVFVYLADTQPLTKVTIEDMKLEPTGSRIVSTTGYESDLEQLVRKTRDVSFPMTLDCVMDRDFTVEYEGREIVWHFKALQVKVTTAISEVDARCYSARVRGVFTGNGDPVRVEYKKAADAEWLEAEDVTQSGVGVTAHLTSLEPGTDYVCRVWEGEDVSAEYPFTTGTPVQLDNMSFENWHLDGKVWDPWGEGGNRVWDSANKATASFTGSATSPDESYVAADAGKYSCKLESSFAVVKFAAGSIFTGEFVRLQGMGAELSWGVPFTERPSAVKGYLSYRPQPISDTDAAHASLKGQNDTGHVLCLLTDWESPFHVVSSTATYVDFDNDPAIIAYGRFAVSETTDGFIQFTLPLEYRSSRVPKYIVIVASSSALGDYFTGGRGSILWLDALSLEYD